MKEVTTRRPRCEADTASDFPTFLRLTRPRWRSIADHLFRRFRVACPAWYELQDCEQDVLMAVWKEWQGYDPKATHMGRTNYVAWRARQAAQKSILRAGEVPQHRRDGDARFAITESECSKSKLRDYERKQRWEMHPEDRVDVKRAHLRVSRTLAEVFTIQAFFRMGGDLDAAAACIYADPDTRLKCRLGSPAQALALASRSLEAVAHRFQQLEAHL